MPRPSPSAASRRASRPFNPAGQALVPPGGAARENRRRSRGQAAPAAGSRDAEGWQTSRRVSVHVGPADAWRWSGPAGARLCKQHASDEGNAASVAEAVNDAAKGGQPDPSPIRQLALGFMGSRVLQVATGIGLFTALGNGSMTAEQLGRALELHPRGTYDFFDALVSLKLLDREGDGQEARYKNTPSTAAFLVKGKPEYIGAMFEFANSTLYSSWSKLEGGLRTGQPQTAKGGSVYDELVSTGANCAMYLDALDSIQVNNFRQFAAKFDARGYKSVADVGCGSALLCVIMGQHHPHLTFHAFELPSVALETQRRVDAAGMADRIEVHSGDFFVNDIPKADVIFMGQVLHNWNLQKKMDLIKKAYDALPEGGAFVVVENVLDEARRENTLGFLVSLHMLLEFGDGFDFTGADFRGWCSQVGFRRFDTIFLGGPSSALVAYK